jgi:RNA polymerase sigma-70 factor, ECF subfamily
MSVGAGTVVAGLAAAGWRRTAARVPGRQMDDAAERELLGAIAAGDGNALGSFYRLRGGELLAYLAGICQDEQVAQELLQDTMLKVWRHAASYRGDASPRTWLFAIARRTARDFLRRPYPLAVPDTELDKHPAPWPDEPEAGALASAGTTELLASFGKLSPLHREVLLLVALHGLSVREVAQVLEVAEGTVKSRLHHARRALAAVLADHEREGTR